MPCVWQLGADALEEFRWYLEDYLLAPFGVGRSRAAWAAGTMETRCQETGTAGSVSGLGKRTEAIRLRAPGRLNQHDSSVMWHRFPMLPVGAMSGTAVLAAGQQQTACRPT